MRKKYQQFKNIDQVVRKKNYFLDRKKYLRLDKNEMISEIDLKFLKLIRKNLNSNHLTTYPEIENLYFLLSKKFKLSRDMFVITAGSDLAIKNCFELLVRKNDEIITINPTYGMVNVYAKLFEAKKIQINYKKNLFLDTNEIIKKINRKTSLIIIANPNSPTGTDIEENQLIKILKKAKKYNSHVLLDECYQEYYGRTYVSYVKKFSNLIVSRSFSKTGLAGCRVGFLISNKKLAKRLYKFRPFYEITSFSAYILDLILRKNIITTYVRQTLAGKKILINYFKKKNIKCFKSHTNFILVEYKSARVLKKLYNFLKKNKFLTTLEKNIPGHKNIIRFTVGPIKEMNFLIKTLNKFKFS